MGSLPISMSTQRAIPLVNLEDFVSGNEEKKQAFINSLASAFREIGFVGVTGHGIPSTLIKDFYGAAKKFFALSQEKKNVYEFPGAAGQKGYTSFGREHAKGSKNPDLKEFFQIGRETSDMSKDERNPDVVEVPEFMDLGKKLYSSFEVCGNTLLRAIAIHLKLSEDYFDVINKDGISILRAIHYPPITEEPASAIRAEQHEDINLITLLVGASAGGLQLQTQSGEWLDVIPQHDEIVINVGDMLQRLTNKYLKSTTHRVVNPPREEWSKPRLSIPFFLHPHPDTSLKVLNHCVSAENPEHFPPITAIEYLNERLRDIGLKRD